MDEEQFLVHIFGVATGWLGWAPDAAWQSTVTEITIALEAKIDFIQMQNGTKKTASKTKKGGPDMGAFIAEIIKDNGNQVHG